MLEPFDFFYGLGTVYFNPERYKMIEVKDLEHRFAYHAPPNKDVADLHGEIRDATGALAQAFLAAIPDCRERSLAFTKLEEAMMWANAAIARNHEKLVDGTDA